MLNEFEDIKKEQIARAQVYEEKNHMKWHIYLIGLC